MKKTILNLAATAAALAFANTASAATFNIQNISTAYNGPTGVVELGRSDYSGSFSPQNISGVWNGELVSFLAYCLEVTQNSATGVFNVVSLADYVDASRANNIAALISTYAGSGNRENEAALQLALWEARHESQRNSLNVKSGQFELESVSGMSGQTLANKSNNFLANMGPVDSNLQFWVATSKSKQDLLFYTVKPAVPEPATWAMMIIGFASIGRAMRSRRSNMAVSFS